MFTRFNGNVVPFADDATSTNRTVFGGTTQSDTLDDNLNADFKKGWEIVGLNDNPTREDFNGMGYTLGALTAYLYEMGISEWNASQNYRTNSRTTGSDGKIYKSLTGTTGIPNVGNNPTTDSVNWQVENIIARSTNITVNVGVGQTYTTINQALEYLSGFYPLYKKSGVTATINLKAGFVMNEQVLVSGLNLGWITIVGEDAETIITHTALTTAFYGSYPVFGVDKGGTSPVIGQLFRFNVEKVGGGKPGLMTYGAGSSADVLDGKGFIGAGTYGIFAIHASTINANGANASNAGAYGIIADRSSTINAQNANASNAGIHGIITGQGSTIDANGANASNAGAYGIIADRSSTINAQNANASNAGIHGIIAGDGSTIDANGANASNAGTHGIYARGGSTINAFSAIIQNQTTGTSRVRVEYGSTIVTNGINTTGGTVPVLSQTANTLTGNGIIYQ